MQHLLLGVAALVVLGAVAGVLGLLLTPGARRIAPSTAVLLGVVLAFVGGFTGYLLGPKGGGSSAFLTGPAWAGAAGGAVLTVALLLLLPRRRS